MHFSSVLICDFLFKYVVTFFIWLNKFFLNENLNFLAFFVVGKFLRHLKRHFDQKRKKALCYIFLKVFFKGGLRRLEENRT